MNITEKIYRKHMIELCLKSFHRSIENKREILFMCNSDVKFLHDCVRGYRGKLTITKRIERIRSGNHLY